MEVISQGEHYSIALTQVPRGFFYRDRMGGLVMSLPLLPSARRWLAFK